ncbi:hypothetical protein BZL30_3857 [Mycobacterium kansasii]|uniref:Uncharacterized protein n=1 Tax=Mycobacterium kansasii TaxID=1768 RepID=A0A1V3XBY8_MYCKA|nr:hypothetical protein BZL30_3857 [Mycobacterium kansasii]
MPGWWPARRVLGWWPELPARETVSPPAVDWAGAGCPAA